MIIAAGDGVDQAVRIALAVGQHPHPAKRVDIKGKRRSHPLHEQLDRGTVALEPKDSARAAADGDLVVGAGQFGGMIAHTQIHQSVRPKGDAVHAKGIPGRLGIPHDGLPRARLATFVQLGGEHLIEIRRPEPTLANGQAHHGIGKAGCDFGSPRDTTVSVQLEANHGIRR